MRVVSHSQALWLSAVVAFVLLQSLPSISFSQATGPYLPPVRQQPAKSKAPNETVDKLTGSLKNLFKPKKQEEDTASSQSDSSSSKVTIPDQQIRPEDFGQSGLKAFPVKEPSTPAQQAIPTSSSPGAYLPPKPPRTPQRQPLLSVPELRNPDVALPVSSEKNPPPTKRTRVDDPTNRQGLAWARQEYKTLATKIANGRANEAKARLDSLNDWVIEATESHIGLYKALKRIPSARVQSQLEKELGLQFALLRDKILLETAKVDMAIGQPRKAVGTLVQVVQSQSRSSVGVEAYELLQKTGFTEQLQLVTKPKS